jgi:metal-responsive CopG/Arc/MetJ family transcriptional regulator
MMAAIKLDRYETVRTTVTLPAELVEQSQRFVDDGTVPSRNALIVAALAHFLTELERQKIDLQFATMAGDEEFQQLNKEMAEEFSEADWEAFGLVDKDGS